jgi:putative tributyrin esterase
LASSSRFRTLEVSDAALAPAGLRFVTVKSAALRRRADLTVFVPEEPPAIPAQRLPVVILLHGVYGSHWAWAFKGGAHHTAVRMIRARQIPPMVIAMPSDGLWGDGAGYVPHQAEDSERWIMEEVPAAVSEVVDACDPAAPFCLAGLSMGGFAALRLAAKHPSRILAAAAHSSLTESDQIDTLLEETRETWSEAPEDRSVLEAIRRRPHAALPALRFDCGTDDPFLPENRALHEALEREGVAHQYAEHAGGHDWRYWAEHLPDTLRFFAGALGGV